MEEQKATWDTPEVRDVIRKANTSVLREKLIIAAVTGTATSSLVFNCDVLATNAVNIADAVIAELEKKEP
jgi:hypothetical protein